MATVSAQRQCSIAGFPNIYHNLPRRYHMNAEQLRTVQAPFKQRYKEDAAAARQTLTARGKLDPEEIVCRVPGFQGEVPAGLHPSAGGGAAVACAGNILLEALVGCTGVTLKAVATALGIPIRAGEIVAA